MLFLPWLKRKRQNGIGSDAELTICINGNVKVADSATPTDYFDRQALRHVRMLFGGKW